MTQTFDPNAAATEGSGIYGLPHTAEEAYVHVLPVSFDATTSYRKGAARGPAAVLRASKQVDLYDMAFGRFYERGIHMLPEDARVAKLNRESTRRAAGIIERGGDLGGDARLVADLARVNVLGGELNDLVRAATQRALEADKFPAILGGDHAVPFGAWQAAAARQPGLGLLHFDAHADLRPAYEGFAWSHASIFYNAMEKIDGIQKLVQVGIRDLCEQEHEYIQGSGKRVETLYDRAWADGRLRGRDARELARKWVDKLPEHVWLTFDIDGLEQSLCPGTGTPVPGGLSWHEALLWLEELARSGRKVLGLDLVEIAPGFEPEGGDSWDAIVGARLLYKMIGAALATRS